MLSFVKKIQKAALELIKSSKILNSRGTESSIYTYQYKTDESLIHIGNNDSESGKRMTMKLL